MMPCWIRADNFLAALVPGKIAGLAWVELSTGRFQATQLPAEQLADELARIAPVECLLAEDAEPPPHALADGMLITRRPNWAFAQHAAHESLGKHFGTATLEGFGFSDEDTAAIRAAGAIIDYLAETQKASIGHVDRLVPYRSGTVLEIDEATLPQPGNQPHPARRITAWFAAGRAGPDGHGHGLALDERMGGQSIDRHLGHHRATGRDCRADGRRGLAGWFARFAQRPIRRRAALGSGNNRSGQPALLSCLARNLRNCRP